MKKKFFVIFVTFGFLLSCKNQQYKLQNIDNKQITLNETLTSNLEIERYINPFKEHLKKDLDKILAYNPSDLTKEKAELNTPLGNFIADAGYEQASLIQKDIDFALFNWGGIRSDLPKGAITTRSAFNLMPFENELVIVEISGKKIKELANYLITEQLPHPVSKQFELHINNSNEIVSLKINSKEIDENTIYKVCTTDYLAYGGDKMNFFKNPEKFHSTNYKFRKLLIDYFEKIDTLKTYSDNRFKKLN